MEKAVPLDSILQQSSDILKQQYEGLQSITTDLVGDTQKFDKTAVKLIKLQPQDSDYVNASYVKTIYQEANDADLNSPYGLMIAAQAPTDKTMEQYWRMIVQENVTKIISLCDASRDNCSYFPISSKSPVISNTPQLDYMIFLDDKKTVETPHFIQRSFEIHMQRHSNGEANPEVHQIHSVEHIQLKSWVH